MRQKDGMVEKTDDQISGLKSEKKIISENILVKQREREKLWSQIEVSATESIGMIGISAQ